MICRTLFTVSHLLDLPLFWGLTLLLALSQVEAQTPEVNPSSSIAEPPAAVAPPSTASPTASPASAPPAPAIAAPESHPIEGVVFERGTRRGLEGISVFILPHKLKAITEAKGRFRFEAVPAGTFTFVVQAANYQRLEIENTSPLNSANSGPLRLFLERQSYQTYETTVIGKGRSRDDTTKSLRVKEALLMPGAANDPIKAVQNLPGVARSNSAQVVIQGSEPKDTNYVIDGHTVPLIFHFTGLSSVLFPEMTERVDLLSAGYGSEYSRSLGGFVSAQTHLPDFEEYHGQAFMDFLNAGGFVEGPLGDGAFSLGVRQSYIGEVLKIVAANRKDMNFSFALVPSFRDVSAVYALKPAANREFKTLGLFSQDELKLLFTQPVENDPNIRGKFENGVTFWRIIPQGLYRLDDSNLFRASLGFGQDSQLNETDDNYFRLKSTSLTVRGDWEHRASLEWNHYLGFDNEYFWSQVDVNFPNFISSGGVSNPTSSSEKRQASLYQKDAFLGAYWRGEYSPEGSPWVWLPQLRADSFKTSREVLASPRGAIRYKWSDSLTLRGALGVYYQPPEPQESDVTYGNPDLKSPQSIHYVLGADHELRGDFLNGARLSGAIFYKTLDRIVIPSSRLVTRNGALTAENYNNDGKGRVVGLEGQVQWDLKPWLFILNYTLSKSTRWDPAYSEYPSRFDQTHNLGLQSAYVNNSWRFSGRLRFVTGNPLTPVTGGVLDADNDVYLPLRGGRYSERADNFFQMDLRADYKWVYDTWILSSYLEVQNATQTPSVQGYQYSYDYSQKLPISVAQMIPSFGIKGEF